MTHATAEKAVLEEANAEKVSGSIDAPTPHASEASIAAPEETFGGGDASASQQNLVEQVDPAISVEDESQGSSQQNNICAAVQKAPRAEGPRKLVAILVAQSASELVVLPMAAAELKAAASSTILVTPTHSVANNEPISYSLNETYAQLDAIGLNWSHVTVDTSSVDLAYAMDKFNMAPEMNIDDIGVEAVVASARLALLWEGAASISTMQELDAETLILMARANEVVSEVALSIAVLCDTPTPVHFELATHRYGFAFQDGAWQHPEIYSAAEAQLLPLSQLRYAREGSSEELALGGYPVQYAKNFVPEPKVMAPGTLVQEAGWHLSLFGGEGVASMSVKESLTPAGRAAIGAERLAAAVAEAMMSGHEVFYPSEYDSSAVKELSSMDVSTLPVLVRENMEQMAWTLDLSQQ